VLSDMPNSELKAGTDKSLNAFTGILSSNYASFSVRRSLGSDIEAACGQLRRRYIDV